MSSGSNARCFAGLSVLLLLVAVAFAILFAIYFTKYNDQKDDYDDLKESISNTIPETPEEKEQYHNDFKYGAMVSGVKTCSTIGIDIMVKKGGSAVDAAIASSLCVSIMHSPSMGIGGGAFMTIYDKARNAVEMEVKTLLAREVAPIAATDDMFVNKSGASLIGGLAVGVPGEIKGYHAAWQEYGRVPWAELFEPAIKMCEDGVVVDSFVVEALAVKAQTIRERGITNMLDTYFRDGEPVKVGDVILLPKLAQTFRTVAQDPDAFYTGQLAEDIVDDIAECGGIITVDDLEQYDVAWKDPVTVHLDNGNYDVYGPPPPSSSIIVQFIINILDGYNLSKEDLEEDAGVLHHRIIEAFKFGYGKRSSLGDEDFVDVSQIKTDLVADEFAMAFRLKIDDTKTHNLSFYEPDFENREDSGTNGLVVLAPDGSAVAIASTVNTHFGSMCRGTKTGIIFNNEMDDFSTPGLVNSYGFSPSPSNYIEPGKRPMSSMSPTIVLDSEGRVVMLNSASGGSRIITEIVKNIVDQLWLDMTPDESTSAPRLHHQLLPDTIYYYPDFPKSTLRELEERGHVTAEETSFSGKLVSILNTCDSCRDSCQIRCVLAACEYRRREDCAPDGI